MISNKVNKRPYGRPTGTIEYRKLFVIVTEGKSTEMEYFPMLRDRNSSIQIKCLKKSSSSPPHIQKTITRYIKNEGLRIKDEAWVVLDKDIWNDEQLNKLYDWSQTKDNYNMALSNPAFEYWLLLHFETGNNIANLTKCKTQLKKHLPLYDKSIDTSKFKDKIETAIKNAKIKDNPPCNRWPEKTGTTVYKLVESILSSRNQ